MRKPFLLLLTLTLCSGFLIAQNLVVDGAPVLLPRLTAAERDLVTGVEGMLIFNTDAGKFQGFVGGQDIESVPPAAGMEFNLNQSYIVFTPSQSAELNAIELYSESGGNLGSLVLSQEDPCTEPNVLATSNAVNAGTGWNTYTFASNPPISAGTTYYIFTNTGTVLANNSQANQPELSSGTSSGGMNCMLQATELAVKIHLTGKWTDLH